MREEGKCGRKRRGGKWGRKRSEGASKCVRMRRGGKWRRSEVREEGSEVGREVWEEQKGREVGAEEK